MSSSGRSANSKLAAAYPRFLRDMRPNYRMMGNGPEPKMNIPLNSTDELNTIYRSDFEESACGNTIMPIGPEACADTLASSEDLCARQSLGVKWAESVCLCRVS